MQSGDSRPSGWKPRRRDGIFSLGVTHHPFVKMHLAAGSVFLLLASLMPSCTSGTLLEGRDGNGTDGGFVPLVLTKVNQIIAREGSCVLIDCNVTGEPFPSFQWFNSHGERLDTESEGEADGSVYSKPLFCSLVHQSTFHWSQNQKRVRLGDINRSFLGGWAAKIRVYHLCAVRRKAACWNFGILVCR